ncbi:MAG: hypothetical protein F3741_10065 [Nitrospinae bacterium]|nr:hypothetical protein [Nitrospinota bacterium]
MRFLMRSPIFLILFTLFSLLSFGVTAIAQETGLPVVQGTYQSASSPAKRALEEAIAAKQEAETLKNEAQAALTAATEALNIAEQQLQAAQEAADAEDQALQVAQAEVDKAQQAVDDAMSELNEAQAALDALNQQLAEAQNKVDEASTVKASAEQALQAALAEISRITGNPIPPVNGSYGTSPIPPVDGTYSGPPSSGSNIVFEKIPPTAINVVSSNPDGFNCDIAGGPDELVNGALDIPYTCNDAIKVELQLNSRMKIRDIEVSYDPSDPIDQEFFVSPSSRPVILIDGKESRFNQMNIRDDVTARTWLFSYSDLADCPRGPVDFNENGVAVPTNCNIEGSVLTFSQKCNSGDTCTRSITEIAIVAGKP